MAPSSNSSKEVDLTIFRRFPLSVILSFLTEEEGTSLLITRRNWAKHLLPIFQLPNKDPLDKIAVVNATESRLVTNYFRHKFMVVPIQDPKTLLERLNTRRFKKQNIKCMGLSTEEYVKTARNCGIPPLLRFCASNNSPFRSGTTLLVSYPRSGNTLLRSLLESITGVVTGSDTRPDRTLSLALAERHDLVGEGVISPSQTPLVKTHWPERIGYRAFTAHRAILLVRNPFDAIDSYWNLNVTNTHTDKVVDEVYSEHAAFFQQLVLNEIVVWLNFLNFWVSQHENAPIMLMRYEDLIQNPKEEMLLVLEFSTRENSNDWAGRIDQVLRQERHGYQSSTLGSNSHDTDDKSRQPTQQTVPAFGKSLKRWLEKLGYDVFQDLLQQIHDLDKCGWLEKLGYDVFQGFPQSIVTGDFPPLPSDVRWDTRDTNLLDSTECVVRVNQPTELELRPPNCPFGRNMRTWRRKHTQDDMQPFPTRSTTK